ncbi:MAG: hypothetical protein LBU20_00465, partial [Candidatus Nomurabacteria bacterium]|nr:hypothetical protein [Candidatus Nomurabacteria bacterium]
MKYVLAVSGGIDSVVLLDMFASGGLGLAGSGVVAHFDHGIRVESGRDAELVKNLASRYQMKFVLGRGKLGKNASEDTARQERYKFLRQASASFCSKDRPCCRVTAYGKCSKNCKCSKDGPCCNRPCCKNG